MIPRMAYLEKQSKEQLIAATGSAPESIFDIGYEDRFMGLVEMPLINFLNLDVPSHRVQLFRDSASGEIIWDRKSKFMVNWSLKIPTQESPLFRPVF